jgi:hypothetical protein
MKKLKPLHHWQQVPWYSMLGLVLVTFLSSIQAFGQAVSTYTFVETTDTYAEVVGTSSTATGDDGTQTAIPIGFTFKFGGVDYTTFSITTNGMIRLGGGAISSGWVNGLSNTATNRPLIAPLWDDNHRNTGSIQYLTSGAPGSQKLEVGWHQINIGGGGSTSAVNNASFKVVLYETSNNIDIVYGGVLATAGTLSASVGLNDMTSFLSVTPGGGSTTSSTTANNAISSTASLVGKKFTFSPPPVCTAANGGSIAPATQNKCIGQTASMTATGATIGLNISYQWEMSPTGGGVDFVDVTGGTGATTASYTSASLTPGTYYYRLRVTCSTVPVTSYSNELMVVVNELPEVSVSSSASTSCGGEPVTLTADGAVDYAWSPSASLSSATGSSVTATPAISTTYVVTGTDANGCSASASVSLNINSPVVLSSVTASPNVVCENGNSTLIATVGAGAAYCPAGASTDGFSTSNEYISNVTFGSIVNTTTSAGGYQDYSSLSTNVMAGSTYTISVTNGTSFPGDQVTVWVDFNQNGLFTDAGETFTLAYAPTSVGSIAIPANAGNGSTRMRIRLNYTGVMSPCGSTTYGEVEDYTLNISGGIELYTYAWSESPANNTLLSNIGSSVNAAVIPSTTDYTVVVTSYNGCTASGTTTVTVNPLSCLAPTVSAACAGQPFGITANTSGGGAPFTYSWFDGVVTTNTIDTTLIQTLAAGNYTYTVTVSDGCGAICSAIANFTVNPTPVVTATGSTSGVTYQTLNYEVVGSDPTDTYQWQFSTNPTGPFTNIGASTHTLSTVASSSGTFYIQCVVTNSFGCSATTNQITTVITVAGDNVCAPIALPYGVSGPYTNVGATTEVDEPVPTGGSCNSQTTWCTGQTISNSVWFSFVAPPSGRVIINTASPLWDNQLALYAVDNCAEFSSFVLLAANDDGGDGSFAAKINAICLTPGETYYLQLDGYGIGTNSAFNLSLTAVNNGVLVASKAMLSGAYDMSTGLMHDSLRAKGQVPTTEPYTGGLLNRPVIAEPSGETTNALVLGVTGNNAIVDWVYMELRDDVNPATIIATRRALIQRDGDIVDVDGVSPVSFPSLSFGNSYYVTVKHRNHLGIMTAAPVGLGPCVQSAIDFTADPVWVKAGQINGPRRMYGAVGTLWSSDANYNKNAKYNGLSNDKQSVLIAVGAPNNVLNNVYRLEDLNLDGKVMYNGLDNDRNVIASTVGVSTPNNIVNQHTPN